MPVEEIIAGSLIESAGDNFFNLVCLAFLMGAGYLGKAWMNTWAWALEQVVENNQKSNERTCALIADGLLEVVTTLKEYKCSTEGMFKDHDTQAKKIGVTVERIDVKLDTAIAQNGHQRR